MAKLVIIIEDLPEGKVKCECEPSFELMMKMLQSGNELTAAHGYALHALNAIRNKSAEAGPKNIIKIPKSKILN